MFSFKKLGLLILSCSLSSCISIEFSSPGEDDSRYQIDRFIYENQYNCDYVLFESNYTIDFKMNGTPYHHFETDQGKIMSHFVQFGQTTYYELKNKRSTIYAYYCPISGSQDLVDSDGVIELPKIEFYKYFFYQYYLLFDIPYDVYQFNSSKKRYEFQDYSFYVEGEYVTIESGYMKIVDNKPVKFGFTIDSDNNIEMKFSNVGSTEVTPHGGYNTITLKYQERSGNVLYLIYNVMQELDIGDYSIIQDANDLITLTFTTMVDESIATNVVRRCIESNFEVTLSNARNNYVTQPFDRDNPAYTVETQFGFEVVMPVIPSVDFLTMVGATKTDHDAGQRQYGEIVGKDEELHNVYAYYLYGWYNFDENICTFENRDNQETLDRLFFKLEYNNDFYYGDPSQYQLHYSFNYINLNSDGFLNYREKAYTKLLANGAKFLINKEPNNYDFEIVTE